MTFELTKDQWAKLRREAVTVTDPALRRALQGIADAQPALPKAFLPYQQTTIALLEETSTQVLFVEKSRRIGLTWSLAAYAVLKASRARTAGGMDVYYISYAQAMTRDFISDCADWARAFNLGAMEMEEYLWDDSDASGERHIQAFRIKFASGFEINGLSSAPRSLRGKQGVVIIDEAAFVDDLKELLKAAFALLMWGGQVIVCSTHNGAENEFNVQIQDILGGRKPYAHLHIDFDQALMDGLYERICLRNGVAWTPEGEAEWREKIRANYGDGADEELYCVPSQGSGAWLTAPLIEARMNADAPVLRLELPDDYLHRTPEERSSLIRPFMAELAEAIREFDPALMHALGFDFARVADLSVLKLLSIDKVLRRQSALTVEMRNVPGDEQKAITYDVMSAAPRLVGAAFDATGMGWTVAEDMGRHFGLRDQHNEGGLVHAIKFSTDWYRLEMPPLKTAFEDDAISISRDAEHLSDLRLVKLIKGIPRVPDVRSGEVGKKRHGDYAIALALAYYASRMQWHEYAYQPVAPKLNPFAERARDADDRLRDRPDESAGEFHMARYRSSRGIF